jgi:micrococcal nuclease
MTDGWDDEPPNRADDWNDEPAPMDRRRSEEPRGAIRRGASLAAILLVTLVTGSIAIGAARFVFGSNPGTSSAPIVGRITLGSPEPTVVEATPTLRPTPAASSAGARNVGFPAIVVSVVDGDTLHVEIDGVDDTVRIIGIDTPETRAPGTPVQCFGPEATAAAERLLVIGGTLTLEPDPTQAARDRFDRLLAHVFLADGTLYAERMIHDGYGIHYVYGGVPSIYADRLDAAEAAARSAKRGLWTECPPI